MYINIQINVILKVRLNMNNNLLSIGEFSKIANVHIKSLRYYDKLGVLKPIYVDPKTNYRYYSY